MLCRAVNEKAFIQKNFSEFLETQNYIYSVICRRFNVSNALQSLTPQSVTLQSLTLQSVTLQSLTLQSLTLQSVTLQSVTLQSVTIIQSLRKDLVYLYLALCRKY